MKLPLPDGAQPHQATCVSIAGRAILIEGPSGSGKSSLALELIDRGAVLIGDDGVLLEARGTRLLASPHPRTRGLIEVRNLGLLTEPCCAGQPVCLLLLLDENAPRFIDSPERHARSGVDLPAVRLRPASGPMAIKSERALHVYGLPAMAQPVRNTDDDAGKSGE